MKHFLLSHFVFVSDIKLSGTSKDRYSREGFIFAMVSWLGNPYRLGVTEVKEELITGGGVLGTVSLQTHG